MSIRVLIVDDHAGFRALAREVLERHGFDVVAEAADGASALRAAEASRPDVVLLDVQLPDANGFDVADALVAPVEPPLVVMTSTRDLSDLWSRLERSSARGFIPKSRLSGAALEELVRR